MPVRTTPRETIRPMAAADLPAVMTIERAAFSSPWTPATFSGLLDRDSTRLWVAEVDDAVVAYAVVWIVADQAELGDLAVAEEWRGRGIGTRLLEAAVDAVRDAGVRELFLEVRLSNLGAQRLYARHRFEQVGRRRDYYTDPKEDALVLRRRIQQGDPGPARGDGGRGPGGESIDTPAPRI